MSSPWNIDKVQHIMNHLGTDWKSMAKNWCECDNINNTFDFHIPPNRWCALCKEKINNDHYHCGECSRLSQIG